MALNSLLIALAVLADAQPAPAPAEPQKAASAPAESAPVESTESESFREATRDLPKAADSASIKNRGQLVTAQDYPQAALEQNMQGTTEASLLVNTDGRVGGCWIKKSSGHSILDAQTCRVLAANALFNPARDRRGKPVQALATQRMTWRLQDGDPPANSITKMTMVVGPEGQVRSCKFQIFFMKEWRDGPPSACSANDETPPGYWLALRKGSKRQDATLVEELRGVTDPKEVIPPLTSGKGVVPVVMMSARMSFAPDGKRTDCTTLEDVRPDVRFTTLCDPTREQAFKVPPQLLSKSGATDVRVVHAIYLSGEPE